MEKNHVLNQSITHPADLMPRNRSFHFGYVYYVLCQYSTHAANALSVSWHLSHWGRWLNHLCTQQMRWWAAIILSLKSKCVTQIIILIIIRDANAIPKTWNISIHNCCMPLKTSRDTAVRYTCSCSSTMLSSNRVIVYSSLRLIFAWIYACVFLPPKF